MPPYSRTLRLGATGHRPTRITHNVPAAVFRRTMRDGEEDDGGGDYAFPDLSDVDPTDVVIDLGDGDVDIGASPPPLLQNNVDDLIDIREQIDPSDATDEDGGSGGKGQGGFNYQPTGGTTTKTSATGSGGDTGATDMSPGVKFGISLGTGTLVGAGIGALVGGKKKRLMGAGIGAAAGLLLGGGGAVAAGYKPW